MKQNFEELLKVIIRFLITYILYVIIIYIDDETASLMTFILFYSVVSLFHNAIIIDKKFNLYQSIIYTLMNINEELSQSIEEMKSNNENSKSE